MSEITAIRHSRLHCSLVQELWLDLSWVKSHIARHGEDEPIAGLPGSPTFRDVRTFLLPAWCAWFEEFLVEE